MEKNLKIKETPDNVETIYKYTRPNKEDILHLEEAIIIIDIENNSTSNDYNYWNELLNLLQDKKYSDMKIYLDRIIKKTSLIGNNTRLYDYKSIKYLLDNQEYSKIEEILKHHIKIIDDKKTRTMYNNINKRLYDNIVNPNLICESTDKDHEYWVELLNLAKDKKYLELKNELQNTITNIDLLDAIIRPRTLGFYDDLYNLVKNEDYSKVEEELMIALKIIDNKKEEQKQLTRRR